MSKPMVVTLPFVLLLLDYWPLKRFVSSGSFARLLLEKLPFFGLAVVGCALTFAAQEKAHSIVSTAGLSVTQRVGHALLSYVHYLAATFLAPNLAADYPYRSDPSVLEGIGAAGFVAIIS